MRYPGGKGRCYQHLISLMPPHRVYVETHLGGGAVLRHKRRARVNVGIERDETVVARWRALAVEGVEIVQGDAVTFLSTYPFEGDELVYSDPPYPKETRAKARIYRHDYGRDDHVGLLRVLRRLPCKVIVSSYDNPLYAEALGDWRVVRFKGDSHTGPRTETAWLNFEETDALHDYAHVGGDFRERERLRRRRDGLSERIGGMAPRERHALFLDLALRYGQDLRSALEAAP